MLTAAVGAMRGTCLARVAGGAHPAQAGDARGFTLLEVLIAFVIAVLALGVLSRSALSSLHAIQTASRYEEALARARSRLAIATHAAPLLPGDQQGEDGSGFRWRVRITPVASTLRPLGVVGPRREARAQVVLYAVSVWVWWSDQGDGATPRREVRLDTQHVGASPQ